MDSISLKNGSAILRSSDGTDVNGENEIVEENNNITEGTKFWTTTFQNFDRVVYLRKRRHVNKNGR